MKTVIGKSLVFSLLAILAMYLSRIFFHTDQFLTDIGGIQSFLGVFGTLYGIMAAFVVFEVWSQYNKTVELVDREALGLEVLFRLTLYFRDRKLAKEMKARILSYANMVIAGRFQKLSQGSRNVENGKEFRKIFQVINQIKFDDDHDQVAFDHLMGHYGQLSEIRTARITQSLARLPFILKAFVYIASFLGLGLFVLMPFANMYYGFVCTGGLAFIMAMVAQLIEDLDNPFSGNWNITPEPFERALQHIENDY